VFIPVQSSKLLLALSSTVVLVFGPHDQFLYFSDLYVIWNWSSSSRRGGVWLLLVTTLYWWMTLLALAPLTHSLAHSLRNKYYHVSGVPWLIITGSGLDDWIWHLYIYTVQDYRQL
jgi:hypothetical protein